MSNPIELDAIWFLIICFVYQWRTLEGNYWDLKKLRCNHRIPISLKSTENSKTFYKMMYEYLDHRNRLAIYKKDSKLKTRLNTIKLSRRRRGRTNLMGSEAIWWWEESPSWTLQVGKRREKIAGEPSGLPPIGGEKNKQWIKNVFGVTCYTIEPSISDISHGWIGHVRWFEIW
jgi:hypothetical protein